MIEYLIKELDTGQAILLCIMVIVLFGVFGLLLYLTKGGNDSKRTKNRPYKSKPFECPWAPTIQCHSIDTANMDKQLCEYCRHYPRNNT